jgi:hypothetical protein
MTGAGVLGERSGDRAVSPGPRIIFSDFSLRKIASVSSQPSEDIRQTSS